MMRWVAADRRPESSLGGIAISCFLLFLLAMQQQRISRGGSARWEIHTITRIKRRSSSALDLSPETLLFFRVYLHFPRNRVRADTDEWNGKYLSCRDSSSRLRFEIFFCTISTLSSSYPADELCQARASAWVRMKHNKKKFSKCLPKTQKRL